MQNPDERTPEQKAADVATFFGMLNEASNPETGKMVPLPYRFRQAENEAWYTSVFQLPYEDPAPEPALLLTEDMTIEEDQAAPMVLTEDMTVEEDETTRTIRWSAWRGHETEGAS